MPRPPSPARRPPSRGGMGAAAALLIILGAICATLGATAWWAHHQGLDRRGFDDTARALADDAVVRDGIARYLAGEAAGALVDASTGRLPSYLRPADGGAAALAEPLRPVLADALERPDVRAAVVRAVGSAHAQAVRVLRDDAPAVDASGGAVVLDLGAALDEALAAAGLPADAVPAGAGRVEVADARALGRWQSAVALADVMWWALPFAALALLGLGIAAAAGRGRASAVALAGAALLAGGILLWIARAVAGDLVVDGLDPPAAQRAAAERAWEISTNSLRDAALLLGVAGVAVLIAGLAARAAVRRRS